MHDISGGKEQELKSSRENEQSFPSCPLSYAPVEIYKQQPTVYLRVYIKGRLEKEKNHKLNSE